MHKKLPIGLHATALTFKYFMLHLIMVESQNKAITYSVICRFDADTSMLMIDE